MSTDNLFDDQDNSVIDDSNQNSQSEPLQEPLIVEQTESIEDRVEARVLETTVQDSYLTYAMSVIVSRALPDVRDGMKPVHRRIIYVMEKMGLTPGAKYRKSAQVVGEVLGKFHPHGDVAVYDSMVRMAQDFSLRYPLIDGQGNFGSIDGDSAAAMRYTEAKMAKMAPMLVADIDKDTVDFVDNYDGSQQEPRVLPTRIPNLLINGATGIAVGMATNIPPHNMSEVCDGVIFLMNNPEATIEEIMEYIPAPDFPLGGEIYGKAGLIQAYSTGRGKCTVRSKAELEESRIIITEIPYQVNKADLITKIADHVKEKRIVGVRDLRDESNKKGIRIVIETKRDTSPEVLLNQLYKITDLQTNFNFNLLALVNEGRQPKLLNLKEILNEFIEHRFDVVTRRSLYEKRKAEARLHILDGLKIALDFIDEVIALIRTSYDKDEAAVRLKKRFDLSDLQVDAILQMRLQTLTNLDKTKIEDERNKLIEFIAELLAIIERPEVKKALVEKEIREAQERYASPRRSKVFDHDLGNINKEDLVPDEEVLIQLTQSQYMKVLPTITFRTQGRGGRGVSSINPKDEDWVKQSIVATMHDYLYAFTNYGRCFRIRVFDLPGGSRAGRGQSLVNYLELQDGEKVGSIITITKEQEEDRSGSLVFVTKKGLVKRTKLELFRNVRKSGIIAIGLNEDDQVVDVALSLDPQDNVILSANNGKTVIFGREQLSPLGRTAKGVKGIKIKKDDVVLGLQVINFDFAEGDDVSDTLIESDTKVKEKKYPSLLVITENGFGKQSHLGEYRKTNRAASGVKTLNMTKKTGKPVLVCILNGTEESFIMTTRNGITIRISPDEISQLGRSTQGIKVIKVEKGDSVVSGSVS